MCKESFIFYKEYKEALDRIKDKKKKLKFYECITEYAFYDIIPDETDQEILALFILIKDKINKENKSYWQYKERQSSQYKKWKLNVLKKDNYKCQICGETKNLVAHHIEPFSKNINRRYDITNGITLCQKCHKEVHKNER